MGFPGGTVGKESSCQCRRCQRPGFDPWVRMMPWRRKWQPTPVFLPGESHGQRSLAGYSPWGPREVDTTELLNTQTHIKVCICNIHIIVKLAHFSYKGAYPKYF